MTFSQEIHSTPDMLTRSLLKLSIPVGPISQRTFLLYLLNTFALKRVANIAGFYPFLPILLR